MKIYIAMINDRHCDPESTVFTDQQKAIDYARSKAKHLCTHDEDYEETDIKEWLFSATYSCEGDHVWVVDSELQ